MGTRIGHVGATWAGEQPTLAGVQWLRDGAEIAGATGPAFTPTAADAGHALSCRKTVRYGLLQVTVGTTSDPVSVIAQPQGPTGPAGEAGVTGQTGATGAPGASGPAGLPDAAAPAQAAKLPKVKCRLVYPRGERNRKKHPTVRCTVSFPTSATRTARAVLRRGSKVIARGHVSSGRVALTLPAKLRGGSYTLDLSDRENGQAVVRSQRVQVG